jgi:predicted lipid-binding transport protein (Tim44 family)
MSDKKKCRFDEYINTAITHTKNAALFSSLGASGEHVIAAALSQAHAALESADDYAEINFEEVRTHIHSIRDAVQANNTHEAQQTTKRYVEYLERLRKEHEEHHERMKVMPAIVLAQWEVPAGYLPN